MPSVVTAVDGDTLCVLAMDAGFLNCKPLRDLPANAALLSRDLKAGDLVTIPDIDPAEVAKGTTNVHVFVRKTSPPVSIRFVHGSKSIPYRQDLDTTVLNVSNFRTTKAGAKENLPFPDQFEFQQPGHDDPDTFKVEVVDPQAGGSVNVLLEAMKPIYAAGAGPGLLTVTSHVPFGIAERTIPVLKCQKVHSGVSYRSKYLRLVTDAPSTDTVSAADHQSKKEQTLLITDLADGTGSGAPTDLDSIDILDQQVRASYPIQKCPGTPKCTVRKQLPIGGGERKRLRMIVHILKDAFGGNNIDDIDEPQVRKRTFTWFRRAYAQANISPLLVSPFVTEEEPPPASDMLTISNTTGAPASGVGAAGTSATLRFSLLGEPGSPQPVPAVNVGPIDVGAIAAPRTPSKIADAVIAALPAGFTGLKLTNIPALNAADGSCDIIVSHSGNGRVAISNIVVDDTAKPAFNVTSTKVDIKNLSVLGGGFAMNVNTPEARRIMRLLPGTDDTFHFYVIGNLVTEDGGLRGLAIMPLAAWPAANRSAVPFRNKAFMASSAMDGTDTNPVSYPHEAGHVLGDNFHIATQRVNKKTVVVEPHAAFEMMTGVGTSSANAENSSKRICDLPVLTLYDIPAANANGAARVALALTPRIRQNGAGMLQDF